MKNKVRIDRLRSAREIREEIEVEVQAIVKRAEQTMNNIRENQKCLKEIINEMEQTLKLQRDILDRMSNLLSSKR